MIMFRQFSSFDMKYLTYGRLATHLFSSRVHNLIVHPSVYFPIPRFRRVGSEQVARRIRVYAIDLRIEDTRVLVRIRL